MTGKRRVFLIVLGMAILGMLGLSIGLTGLPLQPGSLLPFSGSLGFGPYQFPDIPGGEAVLQAIRLIYIIALVVLPFMMIYLIISPSARRQFLKFLARSLPFVIGLYLFTVMIKRLQGNQAGDNPLLLGGSGDQPGLPGLAAPAAAIPEPSDTAIVLITVSISLVMVAIIGWALFMIWRKNHLDQSPNRRIARQAQSALDDLRAGGDLKSTIIRCYYQMSAVLNEQRGLLRSQAMTPHEFEQFLTANGLPGEPIHQLTHLFEEVRYGDLAAGAPEEQAALSSLSAIIEACGRTG